MRSIAGSARPRAAARPESTAVCPGMGRSPAVARRRGFVFFSVGVSVLRRRMALLARCAPVADARILRTTGVRAHGEAEMARVPAREQGVQLSRRQARGELVEAPRGRPGALPVRGLRL